MSTTEFFYTDVDLSGNTLSNSEITNSKLSGNTLSNSEITNSKVSLEIVSALPVLGSDDGVFQLGRSVIYGGKLYTWTMTYASGEPLPSIPTLDPDKQQPGISNLTDSGDWYYDADNNDVVYKAGNGDTTRFDAWWDAVGADTSGLENTVSNINNQVESLSANKADATTVSNINNQVESLSANKADATVVNELKTKIDDFYEITDPDVFDQSMDSLRELQTTISDLKAEDDSIGQLIETNSAALQANNAAVQANNAAVEVERNRITKERKEKRFDSNLSLYASPILVKNLATNSFYNLFEKGDNSIYEQLLLVFSSLIKDAMTIAIEPKTGTPLWNNTDPSVLNYQTGGAFFSGQNADGTHKYANPFQEFLEEAPEIKDQAAQTINMINMMNEIGHSSWEKDSQDHSRLCALTQAVVDGYSINLTFSRDGNQLRIPYSTSVGQVSTSVPEFLGGDENESLREYIGAADFPATIEVSSGAKGTGLSEGAITVDAELVPTASNFFFQLLNRRLRED